MFFISLYKKERGCFFSCLIKTFSVCMLAQTIYDSILSKNLISMKKFLACLFILTIFSAFVFFVGWTQVKVPPKSYALVVSKTSGVSDKIVKNGEFSWFWQFLLPTNASLVRFNIEPYFSTTKTFSSKLPSADFYKSSTDSTPSFAYNFNFSISMTVTPEDFLELYKANKVTDQESLMKFFDSAADYIIQLAGNYYIKKHEENPNFHPENVRREDLIRAIQSYKEYPELEIITVSLTSCEMPDISLYNQIRNHFDASEYFAGKNPENQKTDNTNTNSGDWNE